MQSHSRLPSGVWIRWACCPIAKRGSVAMPVTPGSTSRTALRYSRPISASVVHRWPSCPMYCRSSSQIGQAGGGAAPAGYCVPQVTQIHSSMVAPSGRTSARPPRPAAGRAPSSRQCTPCRGDAGTSVSAAIAPHDCARIFDMLHALFYIVPPEAVMHDGDGTTIVSGLRAARRAANLSQAGLAALAGTNRQTVGALEAGLYAPTMGVALRLARALKRDVGELFWLQEAHPTVAAELLAAGDTEPAPSRVQVARVGGRTLARPSTAYTPADGIVARREGGEGSAGDVSVELLAEPALLERTAVVLGCD